MTRFAFAAKCGGLRRERIDHALRRGPAGHGADACDAAPRLQAGRPARGNGGACWQVNGSRSGFMGDQADAIVSSGFRRD